MPLSEQHIQLIRKSWMQFNKIKPAVSADLFYTKLIIDKPSLKKTFDNPLETNAAMLFGFLEEIIEYINHLENHQENIHKLAVNYQQYGISPKHYASVIQSLLFTLQHALQTEWDTSTAEAWKIAAEQVSAIMKKGLLNKN